MGLLSRSSSPFPASLFAATSFRRHDSNTNEWHAPILFAQTQHVTCFDKLVHAMQTRTPVCSFLVAAAVLTSLSTDRLLNASEFLDAGAYAASRCAAVVRVMHATGLEELGSTSAHALPPRMFLLVVLVRMRFFTACSVRMIALVLQLCSHAGASCCTLVMCSALFEAALLSLLVGAGLPSRGCGRLLPLLHAGSAGSPSPCRVMWH